MSENNYTPLQSEQKILEKFMKILKFYNEIIKSCPLIVSNQDYLRYKKQKVKYIEELKKLEGFLKPTKVNFACEIGEDINTHQLDIDTYQLNIPQEKKTRFNVYILKKINDLENDLEEFLSTLEFFYLKNKKQYDNFSLYTIFASSSLTLIESMSLMFKPQVYTSIATIVISTSVALATAILKLKNYKERIEEIVKTTEKVYNCQSQLFTFDKQMKTTLNMTSSEINNEDY